MKSDGFLAIAEQYHPDLILMNYRLEYGSRGDLCCVVKVRPILYNAPVIVFSAYLQPSVNLRDFGCDVIVNKPFDLDHLLETMQQLMSLKCHLRLGSDEA